jgi:predicted metal-binding membrane protein
MLLLFHAMATRRRASGTAFVPTWVFAMGYLGIWMGIGVVTWALIQVASDLVSDMSVAGRDRWAPIALGAVLILAGAYQFTPLKRVCLRQCQSPVGFVMTHWRNGYRGALRMGAVHGAYCLGCCWALFAVLVATGVMSLAWMLLLTLVIGAEKLLPAGPRLPQAVGTGFLLAGVLVGAGAVTMPWTL